MDKTLLAKIGVFGLTGLLMGVLYSSQTKSVGQATVAYNRENNESIFQEIEVVKQSNDNLRDEVEKLKKDLADSTNHEATLQNVQNDITKYKLVSGQSPAQGQGIILKIDSDLPAIWLTDTVNELNLAGAEVISINGVRLNSNNIGFDTIPNGQILMGDTILKSPLEIEAIGNSDTLFNALSQAGGLLQRLKDYKSTLHVDLSKSSRLNIAANS